MTSEAENMDQLKGQDAFAGWSAWGGGVDASWDSDNRDITSANYNFAPGPDFSPILGPAAAVEGHGGGVYTWGKTFLTY